MMRISALNKIDCYETDDELDCVTTKEAEETIAVSEYMRALSLKQQQKTEIALQIFLELLDTEVLFAISKDNKDDKLFSVKYNCHRNIGFIYNETGKKDLALQHFVQAMELDDTDVFTMSKTGILALEMNRLDIATISFQKCLAKNNNHLPSIDGILQVLCQQENLIGAYKWAVHWFTKDKSYKRAGQVIYEIHEKFPSLIPFLQENCEEKKILSGDLKFRKSQNIPIRKIEIDSELSKIEISPEPDINFKVNGINCYTLGVILQKYYNFLTENSFAFGTSVNMQELFLKVKTENTVENENSEADSKSNDTEIGLISPNIDETGGKLNLIVQNDSSTTKSDDAGTSSAKVRRRGSDLSFLEQWGWHKNRRSTRKKSIQLDQCETVDNSINGFLKRVFGQFFNDVLDASECPFANSNDENSNDIEMIDTVIKTKTIEEFQELNQKGFEKFIESMNVKEDILILFQNYLSYISAFWDQVVPIVLCELYIPLYDIYLDHFDIQSWAFNDNLTTLVNNFYITLFYLELKLNTHLKNLNLQGELGDDILAPSQILLFYSGHKLILEDENYLILISRLLWVHYIIARYQNNLIDAIEFADKIDEIISKINPEFAIKLPNQVMYNFFDIKTIRKSKIELQRKVSLISVTNLYKNNEFDELIPILKDSLANTEKIELTNGNVIKVSTQIELLLESLWNSERYKECFLWSEKCLRYATNIFEGSFKNTSKYNEWCESINFIFKYVEALINHQDNTLNDPINHNIIGKIIQSITRILSNQLDVTIEKNNNTPPAINITLPWIILHQILQNSEDNTVSTKKTKQITETSDNTEEEEENLPNTILLLFTAHEFLGRRQWCSLDKGRLLLFILDIVVPKIRAPILDSVRECVTETIEQITYCLYGYPAKKARSRHIEEHDACQIEMNWLQAQQLYDIYRPDSLPEFDSYKLESVTTEMEQLLQKIVLLIPSNLDVSTMTSNINNFINGTSLIIPDEIIVLPSRISCIFYLLADYYFKNRDFSKPIRYYILDLTLHPFRFDSWAGLALSKATLLDSKQNSCNPINTDEILLQSEEALRCFKQCLTLNKRHTPLWIEYGSFAYSIHAFCSRNLKQSSDTLSMEKFESMENHKEYCMKIAYDCFSTVNDIYESNSKQVVKEEEEAHDEKWLYHYMLGKIAEKQKEGPNIFLDHYLKASKCLYENKAVYPFKISHSNPQNLSIEALEVFYRISSSIMKYLEQHRTIKRSEGKFFIRVLKEIAVSPFAKNKAKLDENTINALKRKAQSVEENCPKKLILTEAAENTSVEGIPKVIVAPTEKTDKPENVQILNDDKNNVNLEKNIESEKSKSPTRRPSHESIATSAATSTTGTNSSSSSSSSESSNSSSDSDSDSSGDKEPNSANDLMTEHDQDFIYKSCIKNLEECLTRFPEHYKSIYRIVNHYLTAPDKYKNLEKTRQLLLGTYTTSLGNKINGLFSERKNNNFFNGIWRIPSSEIDRAGSFSSHLSKCVMILLEVLKTSFDHKILFELALYLQRSPDQDKKYLKDAERKELLQQAISFCIQTIRILLKKFTNVGDKNDKEFLTLLIDIYKAYRQCNKHMIQKEALFSSLLIDSYKMYVCGKVELPENINYLDLAIKLCQQEMLNRKNQEKQNTQLATTSFKEISAVISVEKPIIKAPPKTSSNLLSGLYRPRGRPVGSKNSPNFSSLATSPMMNPFADTTNLAAFLALYGGNANMLPAMNQYSDANLMTSMLTEYYNQLALSKDSLASTSSYLGGPNLFSKLQKNNTSMRPLLDPNTPPLQDLGSFGFPSTSKSTGDKSQKKSSKTNDSKKHTSSELKSKVDLPGFSYTKPFNDKMQVPRKNDNLPVNPYLSGKSSSLQINKDLKMQDYSRQISYENIKSANKMSSMQQISQSLKKSNVSNKVPDRQNMISPSYNPSPGPSQFSPQKTLQQKLAEQKQKANASNIENSSKSKNQRFNDDVIEID